jgi:hypothetical protein
VLLPPWALLRGFGTGGGSRLDGQHRALYLAYHSFGHASKDESADASFDHALPLQSDRHPTGSQLVVPGLPHPRLQRALHIWYRPWVSHGRSFQSLSLLDRWLSRTVGVYEPKRRILTCRRRNGRRSSRAGQRAGPDQPLNGFLTLSPRHGIGGIPWRRAAGRTSGFPPSST